MFNSFISSITQNKNLLMLLSVSFYILSLVGVLSGILIPLALFLMVLFATIIIKNILPIKTVIIWSLLFLLGVINISCRIKNTDDILNLAPINSEITGEIISIPQGASEGKPKFFFKVSKIQYGKEEKCFKNEKVLVTINDTGTNTDFSDLKIYDNYILKGRLSVPFKAGNPSQFDYGNYLRNYDTYAVFYAKDYKLIKSNPAKIKQALQRINDFRENIIDIHSNYLKSPNLEILGGIVFGDDAVSPPKEIKQSFINSGLLHILAASGMNVAFISGFFLAIMAFFRVPYKIRTSIGILTVIIYCFMTGLGASVVRAATMLIFVLIGKLIDRDAHSISLLSFVALLMLLYNPLYINDVGFQLSFIVTFGLLLTAPVLERTTGKILNFLISTVTIPVIAQLWVIPVQIFYFNNISMYSVFANIMSVIILMVISFGGFISSLLCIIKPIAHFICKTFDFVLNPLITTLVNISDFWGNLPNSSITTSHPSIYQILLYYGILMSLTALLYKDIREKYKKHFLVCALSLSIILLLTCIPIKNTNLEITSFDVGNADCFLIKTPDNKYSIIDTGKSGYNGGKSQAEIIILKYLKDRGIKELESIIVTHFDNDHCGGAVDLMNGVKVDKIYVNSVTNPAIQAQEIYITAKKRNTEIILVQNNTTVSDKNGLVIKNYLYDAPKSDNESSVITLLKYGKFTMLFTGDAGIRALHSVKKDLPQNITVLKVPHHGAVGVLDKELVNYFSPKYSIMSVGQNKFGHPSIYTISLLTKSILLRTDINNSIKFVVTPDDYNVMTYSSEKKRYIKATFAQQNF